MKKNVNPTQIKYGIDLFTIQNYKSSQNQII